MSDKVVVNLATALEEDAERVAVAFIVGRTALEQGKQVKMFLTRDAVRLALPGHARGEACAGCPTIESLFEQFRDLGGELLACLVCVTARGLSEEPLVPNARISGPTLIWKWIGDESATVFSY